MFGPSIDRRRFLCQAASGVGALSAGVLAGCDPELRKQGLFTPIPQGSGDEPEPAVRLPYQGPNVILIRFGGGVRRLETITDADRTFCPFIYHELYKKRGLLFNNVEIASNPGIETSHGQGTLYILAGKYDHYEDITHKPLSDRYEAKVPTLFEYLRKYYDVPEHQALIVNGEDRVNEEFYTFSNHHLYGVQYRSTVLSLYRFKCYLLREELRGDMPDKERQAKQKLLHDMESQDYRTQDLPDLKGPCPELQQFWAGWRDYYGKTGLVNPRGDRVLTALALRALKELRPKLMMVNYQDTDYVHWGNPNFYTRAIAIIDDGVRQIYDATQADPEYRDNTTFLVVPDCGRDNNRCTSVPFQHHFGSRSSHQIFVVAAGPGVPHERTPVPHLHQQISVAATVGKIMGFRTGHAEAPPLI